MGQEKKDGLGAWISLGLSTAISGVLVWYGLDPYRAWLALGDRVGWYLGGLFLAGSAMGYHLSSWRPDMSWLSNLKPSSDPRWSELFKTQSGPQCPNLDPPSPVSRRKE